MFTECSADMVQSLKTSDSALKRFFENFAVDWTTKEKSETWGEKKKMQTD